LGVALEFFLFPEIMSLLIFLINSIDAVSDVILILQDNANSECSIHMFTQSIKCEYITIKELGNYLIEKVSLGS
jgi:hypothetical protein